MTKFWFDCDNNIIVVVVFTSIIWPAMSVAVRQPTALHTTSSWFIVRTSVVHPSYLVYFYVFLQYQRFL